MASSLAKGPVARSPYHTRPPRHMPGQAMRSTPFAEAWSSAVRPASSLIHLEPGRLRRLTADLAAGVCDVDVDLLLDADWYQLDRGATPLALFHLDERDPNFQRCTLRRGLGRMHHEDRWRLDSPLRE